MAVIINGDTGIDKITDGSVVQADLASGVAGTGPAFSALNGTGGNVSVSNATWTKVILNAEEWDTNSCFDSSTNYRFQPNVGGVYHITGMVGAEGSGSQTRILTMIRKNGAEYKFGDDLAGTTSTGSNAGVNASVSFNGTTDYVELWVYMTGTSTIYNTTSPRTYFQGHLVRAA